MKNWYNLSYSQDKMNEFLDKYPHYDYKLFMNIAKHGDLEDFRLLCNAIDKNGCLELFNFRDHSDEVSDLKNFCNERVSEILGELLPTFELFRETQKHEYWAGDERYKLFGYDFPPYNERVIIKSTIVFFVKYLNKPLQLQDLYNISNLYNHGLYWDLIREPSTLYVDFENDENEFKRLNKSRKEHVQAWITFMNLIWDKKIKEAYDFMYDLAKQYDMRINCDYL